MECVGVCCGPRVSGTQLIVRGGVLVWRLSQYRVWLFRLRYEALGLCSSVFALNW
ncbi:hypothetical protein F2Q69_00051069 [Brassica cretica]|uniref:Uncharacterized protein n=1 Tax=Brassica cretica TaxID=69181 RepID=A0A8S9PK07_BRACR|nr:hypothetical protein F2Q69_00051069 [Brassica cretica]